MRQFRCAVRDAHVDEIAAVAIVSAADIRTWQARQPSGAIARRTCLRRQKDYVEKPASERRDSCCHIGPSGSSQDLFNTRDLLVSADDSLAHQ